MSQPPLKSPLQARVSRRGFFGQCSAAAGYAVSGAVAAPLVIAAELEQARKSPIRLGLLGMGHRGLELAEAVRHVPALQISQCFEPDAQAVEKARSLLGRGNAVLPHFAATEEALINAADVDAIVVASPSDLHYRQILASLDAGRHVLAEKPVGLAPGEVEAVTKRILELERQVFMLGQQRRYHQGRKALVRWLNEAHLGRLVDVQVSWTHPQGPPRGRGGWMLDPARSGDWSAEHGDHLFDLLFDLREEVPEVVSAQKVAEPGKSASFWSATLRWPDGVLAQIRQSFLPGGNFASPGLSVLAQYEKGQVDLIQGRVAGAEPPVTVTTGFTKAVNETAALLGQFAERLVEVSSSSENLLLSNSQEVEQLRKMDSLRRRVEELFPA